MHKKIVGVALIMALFAINGASDVSATGPFARDNSNIEAPGPSGPLKGLMLSPEKSGAKTVVLIIPGSGPTDFDGNGPFIKASTYKLMAEELEQGGITSLRLDKRGMFSSSAAIPDANSVSMADYAQDVHVWIDVIKKSSRASCVWLLGHSEGALVALVAAQKPENICGLVLAASPGRPMSDVLREQMKTYAKTKKVLDQALAAIDALEAGKRVDTADMHPVLKPVFRAEVQGFMMSLMSIKPTALLAGFKKPVLILQGKRDLQVKQSDAEVLKKANPAAKLVLFADVNHVFKTVKSDDRKANLMTYTNPHLSLAAGITEEITKFIKEHQGG
jgi:uncharacterized protein